MENNHNRNQNTPDNSCIPIIEQYEEGIATCLVYKKETALLSVGLLCESSDGSGGGLFMFTWPTETKYASVFSNT